MESFGVRHKKQVQSYFGKLRSSLRMQHVKFLKPAVPRCKWRNSGTNQWQLAGRHGEQLSRTRPDTSVGRTLDEDSQQDIYLQRRMSQVENIFNKQCAGNKFAKCKAIRKNPSSKEFVNLPSSFFKSTSFGMKSFDISNNFLQDSINTFAPKVISTPIDVGIVKDKVAATENVNYSMFLSSVESSVASGMKFFGNRAIIDEIRNRLYKVRNESEDETDSAPETLSNNTKSTSRLDFLPSGNTNSAIDMITEENVTVGNKSGTYIPNSAGRSELRAGIESGWFGDICFSKSIEKRYFRFSKLNSSTFFSNNPPNDFIIEPNLDTPKILSNYSSFPYSNISTDLIFSPPFENEMEVPDAHAAEYRSPSCRSNFSFRTNAMQNSKEDSIQRDYESPNVGLQQANSKLDAESVDIELDQTKYERKWCNILLNESIETNTSELVESLERDILETPHFRYRRSDIFRKYEWE